MKFQKCLGLVFVLISLCFSHAILLMVDLENDSTIYIEGGLSTGRVPAGATISVTEKATGRPLWQGLMPDSGNLTLPLPEKPYTVTLNLSEGHSVTKSGPTKKVEEAKTTPREEKVIKESMSNKGPKSDKGPKDKKGPRHLKREASPRKMVTLSFLIAAVLMALFFGFKRKR